MTAMGTTAGRGEDAPGGPDTPTRSSSGPSAWKLHVTLAAGLALCAGAFVFELGRAVGGNGLSWAYVFEWPIFAGFAVYMWWHLRKEYGRAAPEHGAAPVAGPPGGPDAGRPDPGLAAWEAYVRTLEADDATRLAGDGQPAPGAGPAGPSPRPKTR